jgi:hypothetical protein
MSERSQIVLLDARFDPKLPVDAVFIDGVTEFEARSTDEVWRPALEGLLNRAAELNVPAELWPEHAHWTWESKIRASAPASHFYGIECEGQMQGLLALREDRFSRIAASIKAPIVCIDYVATAPWNYGVFLARIGLTARFRGCGRIFVAAAISRSRELGYNGRVGLHSLVEAEPFYRDVCGLTDMGIDAKYEGLRYFEMTPKRAGDFIERLGI